MKLKELFKLQYKSLSDFQLEVLEDIAKQWALEMVSSEVENELQQIANLPINTLKDRHDVEWINRFQRHMRELIEESTK